MAVNLLPANVPIGYVNNDLNQPIYASPELTRALTNMMLQIGGQTSASPGDVTGLTAIGIEHGIRISGVLPTPTPDDIEVWSSADNVLAHAVLQTHGLLSSWDWIGLTSADGVKYIWVRTVFKSGKKGNFVGPVSAEAGINTVPNAVTGLTATPIIGGIRIAGTLPSDLDLAGVEVWENTVNNVNTATMLTEGLADRYDRLNLLASAGTRYYWVRTYNTSGARGVFTGSVNAIAGTADWQTQVSGTGKPANNADVTATVLSSAATSITMASAQLLKYSSGLAGIAFGSGGLFGTDASGNTTFSIVGSTGAATFKGNITGGANITITGTGQFDGLTSAAGNNWAIVANSGQAAYGGLYANSQAVGGKAIAGFTSSGTGVYGEAASGGIGVNAVATGTGTALSVSGPMVLGNNTFTWHGLAIAAPAGGTSTFLRNDGAWATPAGTGVTSVTASTSTGGLTLASSGGTTPAITLSGTPTSSTQLAAGGHTYTYSGGSVTGTATATFSGANKPGANSSNIWLAFVIDGTTYYAAAWPA